MGILRIKQTALFTINLGEVGVDSHFDYWLLVCQFIEISNQMEPIGEVSNIEQKNYVMLY